MSRLFHSNLFRLGVVLILCGPALGLVGTLRQMLGTFSAISEGQNVLPAQVETAIDATLIGSGVSLIGLVLIAAAFAARRCDVVSNSDRE